MCGLAGAIWSDPRLAVDAALLRRMTDRLAHRGPDDEGQLHRELQVRPGQGPIPGVALGFRRLAIIDLAGGHQPMPNEDETVWVLFNGEIYNFPTLRRRLEGAGHTFRSHSDTETIVHLYEDLGVDCFAHLRGMFAIAIWDLRQRRLVLARDHLGKKPLVYRHEPGRLLFASELKSILAAPDVPRAIDPSALDAYLLYQYVPHPQTIFRGIHKLPPAHYAIYRDDGLSVHSYWQPPVATEVARSEADAVAALREALPAAVEARLQSEVPLGAFLSGGVDSSLVVALMKQRMNAPPRTFAIGFPEAEYDETRYAALVARHVGAEHHEFRLEPAAVEVLDQLAWHYDEPFADSSAIPTWYLSQLTRSQVTVALTGDGGDELFAGYPRYGAAAWAAWLEALPWPIPQTLAASCWQWLPGEAQRSFFRRIKRFSAAFALPPAQRYLEWIAIFNEARRAELYRDDFLALLPDHDPGDFVAQAWSRAAARGPVSAASLADLVTYLPCDLLTKVDIASMAHGLECRSPFLDLNVVELAVGLPEGLKYRGGRGKWILRQAFGDLLPAEIWDRPKMGFGVPLEHWFRGPLQPLLRETLLASDASTRDYFRPEAVQQLVDEHTGETFDHGYRLWALLFLEMWLRRWVSTQP